jgi:hypothetical protein
MFSFNMALLLHAVRLHPESAVLWYDEPDGQYGRPAEFYQQLQDLNLGETWSAVNVPVFVCTEPPAPS